MFYTTLKNVHIAHYFWQHNKGKARTNGTEWKSVRDGDLDPVTDIYIALSTEAVPL